MTAVCVMVLGTTSGAGKSWLTTALSRHYARQGMKVAPFKAQNMSNNARVVPRGDGGLGEIGSAQYFQALAARALPSGPGFEQLGWTVDLAGFDAGQWRASRAGPPAVRLRAQLERQP